MIGCTKQIALKVFLLGLFAGTLDIIAAFIDAYVSYGSFPGIVLNGITTAAVGYSPGLPYSINALLGLGIHLFIAQGFTMLFYCCYPFIKKMLRNDWLIGILYGIFIWAFMRFVILPAFSHIKFTDFEIRKAIKPAMILVIAIGLPLSFLTKRFYLQKTL